MNPILIDVADSHSYYVLFYELAFLVSLVILLVEGRRKKLPYLQWLIVVTAGFISFVVGCRLVTLSAEDWSLILSNKPLGHPTGLMMLGGLLFCVPVILLTKRLVGLTNSVLDAYALIVPVGMCLSRIGCLINGCCFGTVTSGLGVQYGPGSPAFNRHFIESLIPESSLHSLTVHPVQLYESLGCVIAIAFILAIRSRFKSPGNIFYLSGLSYYAVRFFTEFFRDTNAHAIDAPAWNGLNSVQWLMLVLIVSSVLIITIKERSLRPLPVHDNRSIRLIHFVYFIVVCLIFSIASKWLGPAEVFVVHMAIFTTVVYMLVVFFKLVTMPNLRVATLSLIILSPIIMCQTYPEQAESDTTRIAYNTISMGGLVGKQDLTMINGCATEPTEYQNKYRLAALGFSRTVQTGTAKSYTFGLSGYLGTVDEKLLGTYAGDRPALTTYGISPYGQLDYRSIGLGLGLHFGDMALIGTDPTATAIKRYSVYPQAYLRIGPLNRFFGELSWARGFPSTFPSNVFQGNIGFPFNRHISNSGVFRIGTSSASGIFFAATIPAGRHLVIEPYIGFLESPVMLIHGYDEAAGSLGSLSLHYKFSRREVR